MLEINNLTIKTRQSILTDFSQTFESGRLYGLVATNGSGKTTFFRALMGLVPTVSGSCLFDGQPLEQRKADLFYFEGSDWFDDNLSGLDYLNFIKREWRSTASVADLIDFWQMADYIRLPIRKYSLGMKQRLLIALYQVSDSKLLLMDEITNGLDEAGRQQLFTVLRGLVAGGKTIILSSHYKEDILPHCDYLLTLENQKMELIQL